MATKKDQTAGPTGPIQHVPALPSAFFTLADAIAQRFATPFNVGETPLLFIPSTGPGKAHEVMELENYMDAPTRIRETVHFLDLDSFVGYINAFKEPRSVIFIDTVNPKVTAVLDYHSIRPSWCSHKAVYAFPHTVEWKDWTGANKVKMNQNDMGLFIEDHVEQITEPAPAKLLQTVLRMKETRKVTFGQETTLQNGIVEFQYVEEGDGSRGKFELPEIIKLYMPPFRDGEGYPLDALVRYRTDKDNGLILWYELVRPDRVLESAIKDVRETVTDATSLPVYAATGR